MITDKKGVVRSDDVLTKNGERRLELRWPRRQPNQGPLLGILNQRTFPILERQGDDFGPGIPGRRCNCRESPDQELSPAATAGPRIQIHSASIGTRVTASHSGLYLRVGNLSGKMFSVSRDRDIEYFQN